MNMYGIYLFRKRKRLYSILSAYKRLTYVPKKQIHCLNRENKIKVFGKTWTLTCKTRVEVTLLMRTWNDPTVITVILPQLVSHKPIIKVQFLTKVLKSIFPKVLDSFPKQYSIIWRSFCSKFNINSIRTRSKQYQYSEGEGGLRAQAGAYAQYWRGGGSDPPGLLPVVKS